MRVCTSTKCSFVASTTFLRFETSEAAKGCCSCCKWDSWYGTYKYWDLAINWKVTPDAATDHDWIGINDSEGNEINWWFTSENGNPAEGSKVFRIERGAHPPGGFKAFLLHDNSYTRIAEAPDWVDWTHYGF